MSTELYIAPYQGSYSLVDLEPGLPLPVTYSIRDIQQPDKRNSNVTKSFKLPGTAANNKLFNHIFEIGSDSSFNPNKKARCYVLQQSTEVFRGDLQLDSITNKEGEIYYNCIAVSGLNDIYSGIKDIYLDDLDWSDIVFTLTPSGVASTWNKTTEGTGLYFPLIDVVGKNEVDAATWRLDEITPCVPARDVVSHIFTYAGKTFTSAFFDSSLFKRILFFTPKEKYIFSDAFRQAREFKAVLSVAQTASPTYASPTTVNFNSLSYDPGGGFSLGADIWTCPAGLGGYFDFVLSGNVDNLSATNPNTVYFAIYKSSALVAVESVDVSTGASLNFLLQAERILIKATDTITVKFWAGGLSTRINSASFISSLRDEYTEDANIDVSALMPDKMLCSEFLNGISNAFNLYWEQDKTNPLNYIIEPRDDYYLSTVQDWSDKIDSGQEIEFKPMGELEGRRYAFKYKEDKDYWNTDYSNKYLIDGEPRTFGDHYEDIDNDFVTDEKKTELPFSPTPMIGYKSNTRVIPQVINWDGQSQPKKINGNPRLLYWGGLTSYTGRSWSLTYNAGSTEYKTQYPYAGHLDSPSAPTFDLCFEEPFEIKWKWAQFNRINYPDNNLYNTYWKRFITEITHKDSRIVTAQFNLSPADIALLSFRKLYYFAGDYFRLQQIDSYDIEGDGLTRCIFLKAYDIGVHTPATGRRPNDPRHIPLPPVRVSLDNQLNLLNGQSIQGVSNLVGGTNIHVTGNSNTILNGTNVHVTGNSNVLQGGNSNVTITGNSNGITPGLTDIVILNGSAQTPTSSNTVWFGSKSIVPVNGAASNPAFTFSGSPYSGGTGTTTKPLVLIEPSGTPSTNWNTLGTLMGINALTTSGIDYLTLSGTVNQTSGSTNTRKLYDNPTFTSLTGTYHSIYINLPNATPTGGGAVWGMRQIGTVALNNFDGWLGCGATAKNSTDTARNERLRVTGSVYIDGGSGNYRLEIGGAGYFSSAVSTGNGTFSYHFNNWELNFDSAGANNRGLFNITNNTNFTATSGTLYLTKFGLTFNPTSGTAIMFSSNYSVTVNQTGGANGVSGAIRIVPTLTAAADWRSIHIDLGASAHYGIYVAGSASKNYFENYVGIGATAPVGTEKLRVNGTSYHDDSITILCGKGIKSSCGGSGTGIFFGDTSDKIGFYGNTGIAKNTGWTVTGYAQTKTYDTGTATLANALNFIGTLIEEVLKPLNLIGG